METTTKGMQITSTVISEGCRKIHGEMGALEIALSEIKDKYVFTLTSEVNKKATIRITMTVDRHDK